MSGYGMRADVLGVEVTCADCDQVILRNRRSVSPEHAESARRSHVCSEAFIEIGHLTLTEVCAKGNGVGCDALDCQCACHAFHAPIFSTTEEVIAFHKR